MTSFLFQSDLAWRLGWTLLHSLWQLVLLAMAAAALLAVVRRSASARYLIACGSLAAMYPLLLATFLLAPPRPAVLPAVQSAVAAGIAAERIDVPATERAVAALGPSAAPVGASSLWERTVVGGLQRVHDWAVSANGSLWLSWIVVAWLAGVGALSLWNLGGCLAVQRLRRLATPIEDLRLRERAAQLARQMRVSRPVELLESLWLETPVMIGWLRPAILLPPSLSTSLTATQWDALLAHEFAHVRRYDYLANLLQTLTETLLFFHPAVWWLSRRARIEREYCCDDAAAAACGSKLEYAQALTAVEQSRASARLALAARGTGSLLSRRIRRILERPASARGPWLRGGAMLSLLTALTLSAAMTLGVVESQRVALADDQAKPRQDEPQQPKDVNGFTPVREALLSFGSQEAAPYLDLETGRVFTPPANLQDDQAKRDWCEQQGIDVELTVMDGSLSLQFYGVYAVPTEREKWGTITADEMRQAYRDAGFAIVPEERFMAIRLKDDPPNTMYLADRGLLQVTQVDLRDPVRITVRYQLLQADEKPAAQEKPQEEPQTPRVVRQIFQPTTRGSNQTSWTKLFVSQLGDKNESMMMVRAHRGDRWPVAFVGQDKPLFQSELIDGNDEQVKLQILDGDRRETLTLLRDKPQTVTVAGREFRIAYATSRVEGREPARVDHATIIVTTKKPGPDDPVLR